MSKFTGNGIFSLSNYNVYNSLKGSGNSKKDNSGCGCIIVILLAILSIFAFFTKNFNEKDMTMLFVVFFSLMFLATLFAIVFFNIKYHDVEFREKNNINIKICIVLNVIMIVVAIGAVVRIFELLNEIK